MVSDVIKNALFQVRFRYCSPDIVSVQQSVLADVKVVPTFLQ